MEEQPVASKNRTRWIVGVSLALAVLLVGLLMYAITLVPSTLAAGIVSALIAVAVTVAVTRSRSS